MKSSWCKVTLTNGGTRTYHLILSNNKVIMKGRLWRIWQWLRRRQPQTCFWTTEKTFLDILTGDTTVRRSLVLGDLKVSSQATIYNVEEISQALDSFLKKAAEILKQRSKRER